MVKNNGKYSDKWKLIETLSIPGFLIEAGGNILNHNESALQTFNLTESVTGKNFELFLAEHFKDLNRNTLLKSPFTDDQFHILHPVNKGTKKESVLFIFSLEEPSSKNQKFAAIVFTQMADKEKNILMERHFHYLKTINRISSKGYQYDTLDFLTKFVVSELYNEEYSFFHVAIFLRNDSFKGDYIEMISVAGESGKILQSNNKSGYRQPVSQGVIGETIRRRKPIVINDTEKIDYYHSLPYFRGKSELCVPIFMADQVIGVINLETKVKKNFDDTDVAFLKTISDILAANIYRILTHEEIKTKNEQLEKYLKDLEKAKNRLELQSSKLKKAIKIQKQAQAYIEKQNDLMHKKLKMGAELQKSLLPRQFPEIESLKFNAIYIPTLQLGGDFFDVVEVDDDHLGIIIADVSGHGVSAAMIAAMFKALFANYKKNKIQSSRVLQEMNREFSHMISTGDFISAFYLIINKHTYTINFTNGGHPFPLLYRFQEQCIEELDTAGYFVGVFKDSFYEEEQSLLQPGDKIVFYTDGAIEAKNSENIQFGRQKLKTNLLKYSKQGKKGKKLVKLLHEEINDYCGKNEIEDDITLLLMERN